MNRRAIDALMWLKALERKGETKLTGDFKEYELHYRAWNPVCWIIYVWLLFAGIISGARSAHDVFNAGFKVQTFVNRKSKRKHRSRKGKKGGNHENLALN